MNGNTKHGHAGKRVKSREYNAWRNAKKRCFNPHDPKYKDYGQRGITMCLVWKQSFQSFLSHMGICPDGKSLHRIDNDGNYDPCNCVWASRRIQDRHKRNNRYVELNGRAMVLADWAAALGIDKSNLSKGFKTGPVERTLLRLAA